VTDEVIKQLVTSLEIATMMHAVLQHYFSNMVKFMSEESGRRQHRSSTTNAAVVVRTLTHFFVCGPTIWNQIPPYI